MGDFNIDILVDSYKKVNLINMLNCLDLKLFDIGATRRQSNTLLDLFITSNASFDKYLNVGQVTSSISDHDLIFLNYKCRKEKFSPEYKLVFDFDRINLEQMFNDANALNWEAIDSCINCDEQLRIFYDNIMFLFSKHVKKKRVLVKNQENVWITENILKEIDLRDKAYRLALKSKSDEDKIIYKTIAKRVKKLKYLAKKNFFNSKLDPSLNAKILYKNINSFGFNNKSKSDSDIQFTVDELNTYFSLSELSKAAIVCPDKNYKNDMCTGFSFIHTTVDQVWQTFKSIKSEAVGSDDINVRFLKLLYPVIITPLTNIINHSITTSYFPRIWKTALITPIPKNSNPSTLKDYRPISILSMLSKVYEKILVQQINTFLESHKTLLDPLQSGYKRNHSTITALLKLTADVTEEIDKSNFVCSVFLDFSKAFDSISHDSLLSKLKYYYKFSNSAVYLLNSYLKNRYNQTKNGDIRSNSLPVINGVPQGSILGPLLFVLFSNDIAESIKNCKHLAYADDVQLYISSKKFDSSFSMADAINADMENISKWAITNDIRLNVAKTKAICFHNARTNIVAPKISLDNVVIDYERSVKNLGIIFNNKMKWTDNVALICKKVYSLLARLRPLKCVIPQKTRYMLVRSLIIPHFTYGQLLYYNMDHESKRRLEICFNDCIRFIYGLRKYDHISTYKNSLLGCDLFTYFKFNVICFIQSLVYSNKPKYLFERLSFGKSTRNIKIILPKNKFKSYGDCLFVHGVGLWNSLPTEVKKPCSSAQLKINVKNHLNIVEAKFIEP